jgi:RNA-binding protein
MIELTGKEKRALRAQGSLLKPVAYLGKEGFGEAQVSFIYETFNTRELVKIKVNNNHPNEKGDILEEIKVKMPDVTTVQVIGNNLLLYRPFPEDSEKEN